MSHFLQAHQGELSFCELASALLPRVLGLHPCSRPRCPRGWFQDPLDTRICTDVGSPLYKMAECSLPPCREFCLCGVEGLTVLRVPSLVTHPGIH